MDTVQETSALIAANKVEGTDVFNTGGDRVGSIHDLMIDKRSGQVAYAIMAFGGFLGVWNSYHPLPWSLLHYNTNLGGYVVDIKQSRARRRAILSARDGTSLGRPRIRARASRLLRRQSASRAWRAALTHDRVVSHWGFARWPDKAAVRSRRFVFARRAWRRLAPAALLLLAGNARGAIFGFVSPKRLFHVKYMLYCTTSYAPVGLDRRPSTGARRRPAPLLAGWRAAGIEGQGPSPHRRRRRPFRRQGCPDGAERRNASALPRSSPE